MKLGNKVFLNKKYTMVLVLTYSLVIGACKQPAKQSAEKRDSLSEQQKQVKAPADTPKLADTLSADDCPKGEAEPVLKKTIFPNAKFTLQPDKRTGIETLTLPSGDKLTIKQSGCEYYVLTFTFETSRFSSDTADIAYWSNAALSLMRSVEKGLHTPLEVSTALTKLAERLENDKINSATKLKLNDEIDFGGPDPRQYLTIDRISQLADQRYAVELSLSYGPI